MRKYIIIAIIVALIAVIWLIYGGFILSFMGKGAPEVSLSCQKQDLGLFSPIRVKNELIKESGELTRELSSIGNTVMEKIKNIPFLAQAAKAIFSR